MPVAVLVHLRHFYRDHHHHHHHHHHHYCSLYLCNDQKIWITTKIHIFTKGFKHIECGRFLRDHAGFHEHNEPRVVLYQLWHDLINSHKVTEHACTFSCLPLATQCTTYTMTLQLWTNNKTNKSYKQLIYIYINISCKCDTNRARHLTLDAYASRPVACFLKSEQCPQCHVRTLFVGGSHLGHVGTLTVLMSTCQLPLKSCTDIFFLNVISFSKYFHYNCESFMKWFNTIKIYAALALGIPMTWLVNVSFPLQ